jgi:hypothetical protein
MSGDWRAELSQLLNPATLLASLTAGLVAGILAVTFMFSYSAVIFTGDLASYVPRATGQMLFGAVVISVVIGLFSQFRGVVGLPQDNPTAVMGLDTRDKPTLAAVALLHLKRTAAISAVESHLIERVNGRFGPGPTLGPPPNSAIVALRWPAAPSPKWT